MTTRRQHYTLNTVSAEAFCKKCGKPTQHRVDSRKLGPCLACIANLEAKPKATPQPEQRGLF